MKKYAVIVDSTAILSEELKKNPNVYVVPLQLIVEGKGYRDQIDVTPDQWFHWLQSKSVMSTSQPTLADTMSLIEEVLSKSYDHIFILPISSHLSGTFNGFKIALQEYDTPPVSLIDTYTVAGAVGYMAEKVIELGQHDVAVSEVLERLHVVIENNNTLVYADTLERLMLSGRMNKAVGSIASFLKLKIMLGLKNKAEKIEKHEVYRTTKKMLQGILDYCQELNVTQEEFVLYVLKVNDTELFDTVKDTLKQHYPNISLREATLPGAITIHTGLGAIGVQIIKKI